MILSKLTMSITSTTSKDSSKDVSSTGSSSPHHHPPSSEVTDQYEESLRKSGCSSQHYQLQECFFANNNDWRMCRQEMEQFKHCMSRTKAKK